MKKQHIELIIFYKKENKTLHTDFFVKIRNG